MESDVLRKPPTSEDARRKAVLSLPKLPEIKSLPSKVIVTGIVAKTFHLPYQFVVMATYFFIARFISSSATMLAARQK
ncbi:hypothetical protein JQN58_04830 [Aneurinibacillus sp. BA2021]|nr:hypothetical protein [Aneurinibacillus sp. BA2021]